MMPSRCEPSIDYLRARSVEEDRGFGTPCWIWTRCTTKDGYPKLRSRTPDGRMFYLAHRLAWFLAHGHVPQGHEVHHECEQRACVRPEHLRPLDVTTHRALKREAHTHCRHGHMYDPENVKRNIEGHRVCTGCEQAWNASRRRARVKVAA